VCACMYVGGGAMCMVDGGCAVLNIIYMKHMRVRVALAYTTINVPRHQREVWTRHQ